MFITFLDTESFKKKSSGIGDQFDIKYIYDKKQVFRKKKWYPASQKKIWKNVY